MNNQNWNSKNWLDSVQAWTEQKLLGHNLKPQGRLERVSGWALGQILKQKTYAGDFFFKSTAFLPLFSNESQLCATLAKRLGEFVPHVLSTSNSKQWMLTHDFGGSLPEDTDKRIWAKAFERFASLQLASLKHLDELKHNGCLARPIDEIPQQLATLLNDVTVTKHLPDSFTQDTAILVKAVESAVEELETFNLPETLDHGDLHIENVAVHNDQYIFFDWSDGCISHPFMDGTYIFRMANSPEKQLIIEAYLAQWEQLADSDTLLKAWNRAELVCYAHQAVTYGSMRKALSDEEMKGLELAFRNAFDRVADNI